MGVMSMRLLTESRWATVGATCKSLVAARLMGLDDLVAFLRKTIGIGEYFISGYDNLGPMEHHYAVVGAMSSPVTDSVLVQLCEDPRVPRQVENLKAMIEEELDWLAGVSMP
eukprot:6133289-Lingulodinium_polyedra.AAC.1